MNNIKDKEIDQFWLDDLKVLYNDNNYIKFIPQASMTKIQQLNAITRFSIYAFILIMIFENNERWLYVPIFLIIISICLFKIHNKDLNLIKQKLQNIPKNLNFNIVNVDKSKDNEHHLIQYQDKEDNWDMNKSIENYTVSNSDNKKNKEIGSEKLDEYDKNIILPKERKCSAPNRNNPFMNFMLSDYTDDPDKPQACTNINDESNKKIIEDIDLNFNYNLYKDIDDLFDKKNSQRQFYTMPNTRNPNDQKSFAEWLYKVPETCKTDQVYCLKHEDLRYKR